MSYPYSCARVASLLDDIHRKAEPIIPDTRRTSSSLQNPHKVACSPNTRHSLRAQSLSRVQLFVTPWTVAHQASLSMGFPRQEYWSGLPFPTTEDLPDPGIKPVSLASPASAGGFFTTEPPGKPQAWFDPVF